MNIDQFFYRCFLWSTISQRVVVIVSLIPLQLFDIVVSSSLGRYCKAWSLLLRVIMNSSIISVSWRKAILHFCNGVYPVFQCFLNSIFISATTSWWSKAMSAPLLFLISSIDLIFFVMQIWSICLPLGVVHCNLRLYYLTWTLVLQTSLFTYKYLENGSFFVEINIYVYKFIGM